MNLNFRVEDDPDDIMIILSVVEDYLMDEGIDLEKRSGEGHKIEFL